MLEMEDGESTAVSSTGTNPFSLYIPVMVLYFQLAILIPSSFSSSSSSYFLSHFSSFDPDPRDAFPSPSYTDRGDVASHSFPAHLK
ncbi:unnamed protein product [Hydatigera taeniaeformis]|uniref:Ovule protein n=1 Tax=Hydatigena taeniaeformis TaxID=6205 RepID=A0A0R3XCQ6_HYDTA|nr:unnamed protein product [Hydatigera taeniaeformis]